MKAANWSQKRRVLLGFGMRVLMIDDDIDFLTMAKTYLEAHGHDVHTMGSGFGAVNRVADEQTRPDIIVLDAMMPALSGESILHLLSKNVRTRDVRVLLYSNSPPHEPQLRAMHPNVRVRAKGRISQLTELLEQCDVIFGDGQEVVAAD